MRSILRGRWSGPPLTLPADELVDARLLPLLERIGLLWGEGEVGPAAEHIASGVLRSFLRDALEASEG